MLVATDPDEGVPSSGELDSIVVPGVSVDPVGPEGLPIEVPDAFPCDVSSQVSEAESLASVELPLLVDSGLGMVIIVVTDPPSSTSEGTGPAVPVEDPLLDPQPSELVQSVDTGGISVPIGVLVRLSPGVPVSGEALSISVENVDEALPAETLPDSQP